MASLRAVRLHRIAAVPALLLVLVVLPACGGSGERIDLIARFAEARKHPSADTFALGDITLDNEQLPAIAVTAAAATRLVWTVRVPPRGWLRVSIGLEPRSWVEEGDGVNFQVTAVSRRRSETLLEQHVNPFAQDGDRKWFPAVVNLSRFAGEEIELSLATTASAPGAPEDQRSDRAVWGRPEIVVR